MSTSKGFTLLELLIVMLMIGIIISFATLAIGDNKQQILRQETQRLAALIQTSQQQAIFKNQEYAIHFTEHNYTFYILTEQGTWQRLKQPPLRQRQLTAGLALDIEIEGEEIRLGVADTETMPQLLLLSSGEITPFRIALWHQSNEYQRLLLTGNLLGELEITTEDKF